MTPLIYEDFLGKVNPMTPDEMPFSCVTEKMHPSDSIISILIGPETFHTEFEGSLTSNDSLTTE